MAQSKTRPALWWGIGLIVLGFLGFFIVLGLAGSDGSFDSRSFFDGDANVREGDFASLGEQIFLTGRAADGSLIARSGGFGGMMGVVACADCHGEDGQGREIQMMMFDIDAPDIRWSTLTEPEEEGAGTGSSSATEAHPHEPYDRESFATALHEGETPGGEELEGVMPRWDVSADEVDALVDYLQQLSQ